MGNYIRKGTREEWPEEDIQYLILHYADEGNKALGIRFNRNASSVKHKAEQLGLKKSAAWKSKNARECGKKSLPKKTEAERITSGMKKRAIFSGFLYTKGNVTVHLGRQTYPQTMQIHSRQINHLPFFNQYSAHGCLTVVLCMGKVASVSTD